MINKNKIQQYVLISLFTLFLTSPKINGQQCSEFLKYGLYNINEYESDIQKSREIFNFFTKNDFESISSMKSSASDIGIEIPIEPINIGFSSGGSSSSQKVKTVQNYLKNDKKTRDNFFESIKSNQRQISSNITDLVKFCLESDGLKIWLEQTDNPKQFKVKMRYNSQDEEKNWAKIQTFEIRPATSVSYSEEIKNEVFDKVGASTKELLVTRLNDDGITLSVNSNINPNFESSSLPPIDETNYDAILEHLFFRISELEKKLKNGKQTIDKYINLKEIGALETESFRFDWPKTELGRPTNSSFEIIDGSGFSEVTVDVFNVGRDGGSIYIHNPGNSARKNLRLTIRITAYYY